MIALRVTRRPGATEPDATALPLPPAGITIGRADDCDLVLADPLRLVSRQHAQVTEEGGSARIRCVSSSAPLWVNEVQIDPGTDRELRVGDRLRIGRFELGVEPAAAMAPQGSRLERWFDLDDAPDPLAAGSPLPALEAAAMQSGDAGHAELEAGTLEPLAQANGGAGVVSFQTSRHAVRPAASVARNEPLAAQQACAPSAGDMQPHAAQWTGESAAAAPLAQARATEPSSPLENVLQPGTGQATATAVPAATFSAAAPLSAATPSTAAMPSSAAVPSTAAVPSAAMPSSAAAVPLPASGSPAASAPSAAASSPPAAPAPGAPAPARKRAARAAEASAQLRELAAAFGRGAGLPAEAAPLTPEWMQHIGALLRATAEGTLALLQSRAVAKRHMRAAGTHIAPRQNNPLKFSPDATEALTRMLQTQGSPGFLDPVAALQDAHRDLLVHQVAMVAGMRAAVFELFTRLGPQAAEEAEGPARGLSRLPLLRDAALWRRHRLLHAQLLEHLDDDFEAIFGREFLRAYEAQSRADPRPEAAPPEVP